MTMHNKGNLASYEIIERSIKETNLYELFIGEYGDINSPYASIPTDDEFIFNSWIQFIEEQNEKKQHWKLFIEIITKMSADHNYCWFSVYYLYLFLFYIKTKNEKPFDVQNFIDEIINNVIKYKKNLKVDYRWAGDKKYSFSLWDDFKRMLLILKDDYSYNFHIEKIEDNPPS